jgi:hypothetical protein
MRASKKWIALISDGKALKAPLDYTIDAARRHGATIDLLLHSNPESILITQLQNRLQCAGLKHRTVYLGQDMLQELVEYLQNHSSLIFLVSIPNDSAAKALIEKAYPKLKRRIPVPIVLIKARSGINNNSLSRGQ